VHQTGTVDHVLVYPREIVRRALELSASALILVHNHPSDDPPPSRAVIDMTRTVVDVAATLGITAGPHRHRSPRQRQRTARTRPGWQ